MMARHFFILLFLLIALLLVSLASLSIGVINVSLSDFLNVLTKNSYAPNYSLYETIIFNIRLPRILSAILIGGSLGVTGAALQGLFKNPLVEPGLIGISAGASLFAALYIVLLGEVLLNFSELFATYGLMLASFVGAMITNITVCALSSVNGRTIITTLLLFGVAINALSGALTGFLSYISTEDQLRNLTFWTMGSLAGATYATLTPLAFCSIIPIFILVFKSKALNAISLGDDEALYLGINVNQTKNIIIIFTTLAVGSAVSMAGMIGFIGLVTPHILRMCLITNYRLLLPASGLLGSVILTLADLLCRTIVAPAEMPVGILTAFIGVPIFIYIFFKERKKGYN